MSLNYNTIQAIVNTKYLPVVQNNIFTTGHFLLAKIKSKARTYNERQIVAPIEYAKTTNIGFVSRGGVVALSNEEILTALNYTPSMLYGTITIYLEDELENASDMAVKNILDVKMKNLQNSLQEYVANYLYTRGTAAPTAPNWNTLDYLVNNVNSVSVGGVTPTATAYTWWKSNVIDLSSGYTGDPQSEADLQDPTKDVYLIKLLQKGIATCKYLDNKEPDCIIVPQYIWDLLESIKDPNKTGSTMQVMVGDIGFTAINFRGIPVVDDYDLVYNQVGDTDGRMYFLNTDYIPMYMNSKAAFTATEFVKPASMNARSSTVNCYGNLAITNRRAQTCIKNIYSPKAWSGIT